MRLRFYMYVKRWVNEMNSIKTNTMNGTRAGGMNLAASRPTCVGGGRDRCAARPVGRASSLSFISYQGQILTNDVQERESLKLSGLRQHVHS